MAVAATHLVAHRQAIRFEVVKVVCVFPFFLGQTLDNPVLTLGGLLGTSAVFAVEMARKASGRINFPVAIGLALSIGGLNLAITALYFEPLGLVHLGIRNESLLFLSSGLSFTAGIVCLWITILASGLKHKNAG